MSASAMPGVCCVCGTVYGQTPCEPAMNGCDTHGYCPKHEADLRDQLTALDLSFHADTAPSTGNSQGAPRCEAAVASTPTASAVRVGFLSLAQVGLICGLAESVIQQHLDLPGWREGEHFDRVTGAVEIRETALADLVGEFCVTGEREAASRLLLWLTRATENSYPPRRVRTPWYQQEAFA